jgi:hypothetical protein
MSMRLTVRSWAHCSPSLHCVPCSQWGRQQIAQRRQSRTTCLISTRSHTTCCARLVWSPLLPSSPPPARFLPPPLSALCSRLPFGSEFSALACH